MQTFCFPSCKTHKGNPVTHICFQNKAEYVCQICLTKSDCCSGHLKYIMEIPDFASNAEEAATAVEQMESSTMARHAQLSQLAVKFKTDYVKDEDETIKQMMKILQTENKEYKQLCRKSASQRNKLLATLNLIKYFQAFHDPEFFSMKVNLSSPKGLRLFLKKAQNHSALLNRKVQGDLKKIEADLQCKQKKITDFSSDSLMFKLQNLLKLKQGSREGKPVSQMKIADAPVRKEK